MKDKLILPDIAFNATGKCTLQYTDPDTGKVMFETSGNNHVFIKQFTGASDFQTTALRADLLLCQGGFDPGDDIPVVPGELIGYGRVATNGAGTLRGTYRAADSYYNKRSRAKVSNKYVYDFLPTQALGRVDWIGLSSILGEGVSLRSWLQPHTMNFPIETTRDFFKAVNCSTGDYYRTSGSTLYHGNTMTMSAERSVSLSAALGGYYSGYTKACLDAANNRVYVLAYYKQTSSGGYVSRAILMKEDLSGAESVTNITSGGSYIQYGGAGGAYNGKLVWIYSAATNAFTVYSFDFETASIKAVDKYSENDANRIYIRNYTTYVHRKYLWHESNLNYPAETYVYTSPLIDIETGEVSAMLPPAGESKDARYPYEYYGFFCPYKAHAGQWASSKYNDAENFRNCNAAYTKYHVPEETPDRPEGMGMTVTYELEIEW